MFSTIVNKKKNWFVMNSEVILLPIRRDGKYYSEREQYDLFAININTLLNRTSPKTDV